MLGLIEKKKSCLMEIINTAFGKTVTSLHSIQDARIAEAWEDYSEKGPIAMIACDNCEELTHLRKSSYGLCRTCLFLKPCN